jgi:hypothetical protein
MAGELQRDWTRTETLQDFAQILFDHAGCSSSVLAWEMQLLGASDGEQMPANAKLGGSCKEKNEDPLYLFACHLAWRREGNLGAYQDLLAGLDDSRSDVRILAESLLHRPCPRPDPNMKTREH